ncbi:MAG: hypothetical protein ACQEVA_00080 [Myxococcota bacterium]
MKRIAIILLFAAVSAGLAAPAQAQDDRLELQLGGLAATFAEWAIPDTRALVYDDLEHFDLVLSWPVGFPVYGTDHIQFYPFVEPQFQVVDEDWRILGGLELLIHPADASSRWEAIFSASGGGLHSLENSLGYFAGAGIGFGKVQRREITIAFTFSARRYWLDQLTWNDATIDVKFAIWLF